MNKAQLHKMWTHDNYSHITDISICYLTVLEFVYILRSTTGKKIEFLCSMKSPVFVVR
jgi:hypothetical protein